MKVICFASALVVATEARSGAAKGLQVVQDAIALVQRVQGKGSSGLNNVLHSLHAQSHSWSEGYDASLDAVLTSAIASIDTDVLALVSQNKDATVAEERRLLDVLETDANKMTLTKSSADSSDTTGVGCLGQQKEALAFVETKRSEEVAADTKMQASCDAAEKAKPFHDEPSFTGLSVVCDVSKPSQCTEQMTSMKSSTDSTVAGTKGDVAAQTTDYTTKQGICDVDTESYNAAVKARKGAEADFVTKETECDGMVTTATEGKCKFNDQYNTKCSRASDVTTLWANTNVAGNPWSDVDRQTEYDSSSAVKCILTKMKSGTELTGSLASECSAVAYYVDLVGKFEASVAEFNTYMTGAYYQCIEDSFKFSGEKWDVPPGGLQASSASYQHDADFMPAVARASDGAATVEGCN